MKNKILGTLLITAFASAISFASADCIAVLTNDGLKSYDNKGEVNADGVQSIVIKTTTMANAEQEYGEELYDGDGVWISISQQSCEQSSTQNTNGYKVFMYMNYYIEKLYTYFSENNIVGATKNMYMKDWQDQIDDKYYGDEYVFNDGFTESQIGLIALNSGEIATMNVSSDDRVKVLALGAAIRIYQRGFNEKMRNDMHDKIMLGAAPMEEDDNNIGQPISTVNETSNTNTQSTNTNNNINTMPDEEYSLEYNFLNSHIIKNITSSSFTIARPNTKIVPDSIVGIKAYIVKDKSIAESDLDEIWSPEDLYITNHKAGDIIIDNLSPGSYNVVLVSINIEGVQTEVSDEFTVEVK